MTIVSQLSSGNLHNMHDILHSIYSSSYKVRQIVIAELLISLLVQILYAFRETTVCFSLFAETP